MIVGCLKLILFQFSVNTSLVEEMFVLVCLGGQEGEHDVSKTRGEDDVNRKPSPEEAAWQWSPAEVHSKPSPTQGPTLLSKDYRRLL